MGKNYVENSLKHFLKRKMKITFGFIVAFMITGVAVFAGEKADSTTTAADHNKPFEDAMESLTGLGEKGIDFSEFDNQKIEAGKVVISSDNNGGIKIVFPTSNYNKDIAIKKEDISSLTGKVIQDSLNLASKKTDLPLEEIKEIAGYEEGLNKQNSDTIVVNKGILTTTQPDGDDKSGQIIGKGKTGYNYGIIAVAEKYGQNITGGTGYNYGIIVNYVKGGSIFDAIGQNVSEKGTGYNYGIIANTYKAGQFSSNSTINNYGIIANGNDQGQVGSGSINNYGIIANGGNLGIHITSGTANNYGIIKNGGDKGFNIKEKGAEGYNYGIIANTGNYGLLANGGIGYNYGLIKNTGDYAISNGSGTAENYGVVKNQTGNVFEGNVDNYGLVILTNKDKQIANLGGGNKKDKGIVLGYDYNIIGDNVKTLDGTEVITAFGDTNVFESFTKGYVKNQNVKIDNISSTEQIVLGAVVTKDSAFNGAVFNYEGNTDNGNELYIGNTVMTGYFEKSGTLLDVQGNKVTLKDTTITAVKDDMSLDVWAVDVTNGGQLAIMGDNVKINGLINADENATVSFVSSNQRFEIDGGNVEVGIAKQNENLGSRYQQSFGVTLAGDTQDVENGTVNEIKISTENAVAGLINTLKIENSLTVKANKEGYSIYDTNDGSDPDHNNTDAVLEVSVGSIHNIEGNVQLGVGKDTFKIENHDYCTAEDEKHKDKIIDLGAGEDKFIVVGQADKNIFAYNVKNAETIELQGGVWESWDNAGSISFDKVTKENSKPNFILGKDTTIKITFDDNGSDFERHIEKLTANGDLGINHAVIQGTDETSKVKYWINEEKGLDLNNLSSNKYSFNDKITYDNLSAIFKIDNKEGQGVNITIKSAEDFGFTSQERIIYEAYLEQIKADGSVNQDVITQINNLDSQGFKEQIRKTNAYGTAYYTAGSVVAKDITETYVSAVQNFTKRAGKGEWLAQGKYVNSDTEFTGGSEVKGYDGDITGTVGMIEYGFTDNTSYGAVFGMGDSKMDIDGGGKLDGDNIYVGLYAKHETTNGIEFVADIGFMENDMESLLRNDFNFGNDGVSSNGKTFEKGTADSSTVSFGVKGRKDYRISDSVKLQPTLGARLTIINQEEAENPEMHFTIKEQDIMVFEGTAGMGIAKEIALSQGALELSAGAEYTFAVSSSTNDAEYTLFKDTEDYQDTHIKLEDTDAAENTGKIYFGADYEHENGVGVNGKYEMLWSDKGDDSRITAGVSYRF